MSSKGEVPEATGQVRDAARGNWVDAYAPAGSRPFLRLSRVDRPIGTWLLLLPCWWGLALAAIHTGSFGWLGVWIALVCAIGAVLMRGAGCTWNDISDREIDAKVARTRSRPLPSGQVSLRGALIWLMVQLMISAALLASLNGAAIILGIVALVPVAIYPFAKRFTWWPQVFLGIAFNWGALLGWVALTGTLGWPAVALYLGGISWTLFYDTIYAHQDTEDDALIGVKSTARLFGARTPLWLRGFLVATVFLLGTAVLGAVGERSILALVVALGGPWALGWHLVWQLVRFKPDDPARLLILFRSNRNAGLLPLLFFAAAYFI